MIVITGLAAEARIAAAPGLDVIACGGRVDRRRAAIDAALAKGAGAILSFGIAGGLDPSLAPGDWIIASSVIQAGERLLTDTAWSRRLAAHLPFARFAPIAGANSVIVSREQRRALRDETGAAVVDMETFEAAQIARAHGLPFAATRIVADPATRNLPHAAQIAMRPDGSIDLPGVLRSIARQPQQLPDLWRLGLASRTAFRALKSGRARLGVRFCFEDDAA